MLGHVGGVRPWDGVVTLPVEPALIPTLPIRRFNVESIGKAVVATRRIPLNHITEHNPWRLVRRTKRTGILWAMLWLPVVRKRLGHG